MRYRGLLLGMVGAIVLSGALASVAVAGRFSTSSQTFRATYSSLELTSGLGGARCAVTLEGSLHARTIRKVTGSLFGYITRAQLGVCSTGTATILTETLPWHMRYRVFSGPLPDIASVRSNITGFAMQIRENLGGSLLFLSEQEEPAILSFAFGEVGPAATDAQLEGRIVRPAGFTGTLRALALTVSVLNTTTRISVTLI